jgi:hypothetical protein
MKGDENRTTFHIVMVLIRVLFMYQYVHSYERYGMKHRSGNNSQEYVTNSQTLLEILAST